MLSNLLIACDLNLLFLAKIPKIDILVGIVELLYKTQIGVNKNYRSTSGGEKNVDFILN